MTLVDALYRDAESHPDHVAFIAGEAVWTNQRLVVEIERLARGLVAQRVQPGDRVALHMTNIPELALAYYACLRIGAIAVPLNIRLKTDELRPLLQRLQPTLYLGQAHLYPLIAPIEATIIGSSARFIVGDTVGMASVRPWANLVAGALDLPITYKVDPTLPAVLLPTSGTTGPSKFVTHSLTTLGEISAAFAQFELDREHVALIASPMVHASGLFTLLGSMHLGARAVMIERFDPEIVLDAIERHGVTWMGGLPFMHAGLVESQRRRPRNLRSVQFGSSAGDVCPTAVRQAFRTLFGVPLYNRWAMTETVGLIVHSRRHEDASLAAPGTQFALFDDQGEPVPRGDAGELVLRGPNIAIGYWKSPGEIDPLTTHGWFHTGDIMRQDDHGELWFVARKKDLLIRGGSNISPAEVEQVLMSHPAVQDAVVVGIPDAVLGQRVVGLVQLVAGQDRAVLRDILTKAKAQMADYKLPERLAVVNSIPRSVSGKVERNLALAIFKRSSAGELATTP